MTPRLFVRDETQTFQYFSRDRDETSSFLVEHETETFQYFPETEIFEKYTS